MASNLLLKVENLKVRVGETGKGVLKLKDMTFSVNESEIVSLVGQAGCGKTLTCNAIMAKINKSFGRIEFNGENIEFLDNSSRIKVGLSMVPQVRKVFKNLTVKENLTLGAYTQKDTEVVIEILKECYELFPMLYEKEKIIAENISSAEQMMLAIAKALMSDPLLLIIDELCLGISPIARDYVFDRLLFLKKCGTSVLLTERKAHDCLDISDRIYLVDDGTVVATGNAEEMKKDKKFLAIYGEKTEEDEYAY